MRGHVERRVGERPAEMPGLRVVAEQHERHAGHVADVFHVRLVLVAPFACEAGRLWVLRSCCSWVLLLESAVTDYAHVEPQERQHLLDDAARHHAVLVAVESGDPCVVDKGQGGSVPARLPRIGRGRC